MYITIGDIMKCNVQQARKLPFFQCIAFIKAYGQIHKGTKKEPTIDATDPENQEMIDKMLG
jgi:hypothetical protein